jgi:hypothetical protein
MKITNDSFQICVPWPLKAGYLFGIRPKGLAPAKRRNTNLIVVMMRKKGRYNDCVCTFSLGNATSAVMTVAINIFYYYGILPLICYTHPL